MSREDFGKGWLLLIAQPWGKRYAQDQSLGQVQFDLYYRALGRWNPFVWVAVAEKYAAGQRWPAIEQLQHTLAANTPKPKQVEGPPVEYAPDDYIAKRLTLAIARTSLREAVETVLRPFLLTPPTGTTQAELARGQALLDQWQAKGWLNPSPVPKRASDTFEKALPDALRTRSPEIHIQQPDPTLNES